MKLKKIGEVWSSANRLLVTLSVRCHPKILLPRQRDVTTSPLYTLERLYTEGSALRSNRPWGPIGQRQNGQKSMKSSSLKGPFPNCHQNHCISNYCHRGKNNDDRVHCHQSRIVYLVLFSCVIWAARYRVIVSWNGVIHVIWHVIVSSKKRFWKLCCNNLGQEIQQQPLVLDEVLQFPLISPINARLDVRSWQLSIKNALYQIWQNVRT